MRPQQVVQPLVILHLTYKIIKLRGDIAITMSDVQQQKVSEHISERIGQLSDALETSLASFGGKRRFDCWEDRQTPPRNKMSHICPSVPEVRATQNG